MKFLESEAYQREAALLFIELSERIRAVLPSARIEHIGSSAIVGAVSKGDLDIFVGVAEREFEPAVKALQKLGFTIKEGSLRTDALCPFEGMGFPLDVGVQLVSNGSEFEFFIIFRDRLNDDSGLRDAYNQLKVQATGLTADEYRQIKSKFIEKVLLA